MSNYKSYYFETFKVKCPHDGTITIKERNTFWVFCPKCNCSLDIMNKNVEKDES